MLFFKRNHGFSRRKNVFSRLVNHYSGWLPLIAVFSLGIFGTSIYYKNKPTPLSSEQITHTSNEIDKLSKQLYLEKDITDSLSDKNIELEQKLNEALAKASDESTETELENLNEELLKRKQAELKLSNENKKLIKQLENKLTQSNTLEKKVISDLKKINLETVQTLTQQLSEKKHLIENLNNKNTGLKAQLEDVLAKVEAKKADKIETLANASSRNIRTASVLPTSSQTKNFNKVKIDTNSDDLTQNKINQLMNRNLAKSDPEIIKDEAQQKSTKERTLKLKKGEGLWDLSVRAYGKGHYYKKIIKANTKVTEKNFKSLRAGTKLRIPFINK